MIDELVLLQDNWKDGRRWQLTVATELPELEEKQFNNRSDRGGGRGRGGFRGGRGRGFGGRRSGGGGGGYGQNRGGHKRSFSQAFH